MQEAVEHEKSLKIVVGEATAPLLPAAPVARSWACKQNRVRYVNHLPPINTFNGSGGTVARKKCRRNSSQSATKENDHEHARHQKKGRGKYPIAVSKRRCNRILCSIGHVVIGRNCGIRLSAQAHTTTRNLGRPPHKQHPPHNQSNNHHHSGNRVTMMTRTRRCYVGEQVRRSLCDYWNHNTDNHCVGKCNGSHAGLKSTQGNTHKVSRMWYSAAKGKNLERKEENY